MSIIQMALSQQLQNVECITTWALCDNVNRGPTPEIVTDAVQYMIDTFIPALNALQSDDIVNDYLYITQVGYPSTSRSQDLTGGGAIVSTGANTLPPYLALYIRQDVGLSINAQTGGSYDQSRAIRRGGVYLPGMTEDWSNVTGVDVPSTLATAWGNWIALQQAPLTINLNGDPFYHAVWVTPKPAGNPTPSFPAGKPASPFLQAPITQVSARLISRLKTRRG